MKWKDSLTAASICPPIAHYDVVLQGAGSVIVVQELTGEFVHSRIVAQSVDAGGDVGLWVDGVVTAGEGSRPQEVTAVP